MAPSGDTQPKATFGAGNLYTPEEPVLHSFSKADEAGTKLAPIQTLSPPVSPETNTLASFSSVVDLTTYDAPLYPEHSQSESQHSPLFGPDNQAPTPARSQRRQLSVEERAVALGITNLGAVISPLLYIPPTRKGANDYYNARLMELEKVKALKRAAGMLPMPKKSAASARDPVTTRQLEMLDRSANGRKPTGVAKINPAPKVAAPKLRTVKATSPVKEASPTKAATTARRTPRAQTIKEFDDRAFPQSSQQPKHKRAAPTKKVAKEDDSTWRELPDYCPPTSSLDAAPKPLKAQWKGNLLDISKEPDLDQLDARERELASELRLKPVQYMANKRRMFVAKLQSMKVGKGFTKTAAQTVTNIDVNKTSKLWEAFDRVGWWEETWFAQWVDESVEDV